MLELVVKQHLQPKAKLLGEASTERIAAQKASKLAAKGGSKGRKKGTKNTPKSEKEVYETAPFRAFKAFFLDIMRLLSSLIPELKMTYLVVDSAYGNPSTCKCSAEGDTCTYQ